MVWVELTLWSWEKIVEENYPFILWIEMEILISVVGGRIYKPSNPSYD